MVLIVGAGTGVSASIARLFAQEEFKVALAARQIYGDEEDEGDEEE